MDKNKRMAEEILKSVGGVENIAAATHCMTRLRFTLKDDTIPVDEDVKNIEGVIGVNRTENQYQVIIGPNVAKVYDAVCQNEVIGNQTETKQDDQTTDCKKLTWKSVGKKILNYMAGCMTPMIPILLAAGLINAINSICGPDLLGLYTHESNL